MNLKLRKVIHPEARDNYRVILNTKSDTKILAGAAG
jgi:hypothetical protein